MAAMEEVDQDLEFTRGVRKDVVTALTKGGIAADDPKKLSILLQTLDGMDRAALTQKRIKADEGISSTKAAAAATIAHLFMDNRLKSVGAILDVEARPARATPQLGNDVPDPMIIDGELGPTNNENYDAFMARTGFNDHHDERASDAA